MFTKFKKGKSDPLKGLGAYKQIKRHEKNTQELYDTNRGSTLSGNKQDRI